MTRLFNKRAVGSKLKVFAGFVAGALLAFFVTRPVGSIDFKEPVLGGTSGVVAQDRGPYQVVPVEAQKKSVRVIPIEKSKPASGSGVSNGSAVAGTQSGASSVSSPTPAPAQEPRANPITINADAGSQSQANSQTETANGSSSLNVAVTSSNAEEPLGAAETREEPSPTPGESPDGAAAASVSPPGHCDYSACASAYRSFRASDCTYQPYDGPRRVCQRDGRADPAPVRSANRSAPYREDRFAPYRDRAPRFDFEAERERSFLFAGPPRWRGSRRGYCNYQACGMAYQSFDPSDCTYQPYGGPRAVCQK